MQVTVFPRERVQNVPRGIRSPLGCLRVDRSRKRLSLHSSYCLKADLLKEFNSHASPFMESFLSRGGGGEGEARVVTPVTRDEKLHKQTLLKQTLLSNSFFHLRSWHSFLTIYCPLKS